MRFLYYLSDSMIPFVLLLVAGYGMLSKVDIFDAFEHAWELEEGSKKQWESE